MKNRILLLTGLLIAQAGVADVIVAYWDFGPDAAGYTENVLIENAVGTPLLTGMSTGTGYDDNGQVGAAFIDADGTSHSAGQALAWNNWVNNHDQGWVLRVDLTGYEGLSIRWDYRSSGTGPSGAILDYSLDGENWDAIENISLTADSNYHSYTKDLSAITAINNASSVQFRLSGFSGAKTFTGTHRIDNLQIEGIPEPAVLGFIALTGIGILITRRFTN